MKTLLAFIRKGIQNLKCCAALVKRLVPNRRIKANTHTELARLTLKEQEKWTHNPALAF